MRPGAREYWAWKNILGGEVESVEPEIQFNTHSLVTSGLGNGIQVVDQNVYPSVSPGTDKSFSIEALIKPTANNTLGYFMKMSDGTVNRLSVIVVGNNIRVELFSATTARIRAQTTSGGVVNNQWNHIVCTYTGSKLYSGLAIYINNVLATTSPDNQGTYAGFPAIVDNINIQTPRADSVDNAKYIGKINLLRIFHDKVFDSSEVSILFNGGTPIPLDGLSFEENCVFEHRYNNHVQPAIGAQTATVIGDIAFDLDIPENEATQFVFTGSELPNFYWPQIHKSSDWPEIPTIKPYFLIVSTDHSTLELSGIEWAECDDPYGNGYVTRGKIVSGNQAESPYLIRIPSAKSGISDEIFLYYHTNSAESGNAGKQQTRLITTTGGVLHTATWTDRGRPLGIFNDDVHTGYCRVWVNTSGNYIANHLTVGFPTPKHYVSTSSTGLNFTRLLLTTPLLVDGYDYLKNQICPFVWNGIQYGLVILIDGANRMIAITTLDENFLPQSVVSILIRNLDFRTMNLYKEDNIMYVHYKGGSNDLNNQPTYVRTFNVSDIIQA